MEDKKANELNEKDFFKILWDYFSLHATQRMHMLNFYIILETLFTTAIITLFQFKNQGMDSVRIILSIAIIVFSIIFYLLDKRAKTMIKLSENLIIEVENKYKDVYGSEFMIFSAEKNYTDNERKKCKAKKLLSYSKLLNFVYIFFIIIAVICIIIEIIY